MEEINGPGEARAFRNHPPVSQRGRNWPSKDALRLNCAARTRRDKWMDFGLKPAVISVIEPFSSTFMKSARKVEFESLKPPRNAR